MKKDGKYRYSLQFGMGTEEEIRAGELLENLGNRKSKVLIAALNEYIANHIKWFLKNHPDRVNSFLDSVKTKYSKKNASSQTEIFFNFDLSSPDITLQ